ncbi:Uncharacterised protein [Rikenella microfusus]|uniref:Uncharacterized protein n=1 Tax=Rikenella microfusus TaxID=28139 RepID=A0A379MSW0_9BACT|nr:Uncharacterised protein [Rikenella microfusus]
MGAVMSSMKKSIVVPVKNITSNTATRSNTGRITPKWNNPFSGSEQWLITFSDNRSFRNKNAFVRLLPLALGTNNGEMHVCIKITNSSEVYDLPRFFENLSTASSMDMHSCSETIRSTTGSLTSKCCPLRDTTYLRREFEVSNVWIVISFRPSLLYVYVVVIY